MGHATKGAPVRRTATEGRRVGQVPSVAPVFPATPVLEVARPGGLPSSRLGLDVVITALGGRLVTTGPTRRRPTPVPVRLLIQAAPLARPSRSVTDGTQVGVPDGLRPGGILRLAAGAGQAATAVVKARDTVARPAQTPFPQAAVARVLEEGPTPFPTGGTAAFPARPANRTPAGLPMGRPTVDGGAPVEALPEIVPTFRPDIPTLRAPSGAVRPRVGMGLPGTGVAVVAAIVPATLVRGAGARPVPWATPTVRLAITSPGRPTRLVEMVEIGRLVGPGADQVVAQTGDALGRALRPRTTPPRPVLRPVGPTPAPPNLVRQSIGELSRGLSSRFTSSITVKASGRPLRETAAPKNNNPLPLFCLFPPRSRMT